MPISDHPQQSSGSVSIVKAQQRDSLDSASQSDADAHTFDILPSGDDLARYPADIQRIIVIEWVENRKHRAVAESRRQRNAFIDQMVRLTFGFALAVAFMVSGVIVIVSGHGAEGLIGIGTTVTAIAVVYVRRGGRKS